MRKYWAIIQGGLSAVLCLWLCLQSALAMPAESAQTQSLREELSALTGGKVVPARALAQRFPGLVEALGLNSELSRSRLSRIVSQDRDAWVDGEGRLLYACEGLVVPEAQRMTAAQAMAAHSVVHAASIYGVINSSTDAFKLHSLPGCPRVLYLDFVGHTTSGTNWNTAYTAGADFVSAPFDMDGNPTTFNDAERALIKAIWERVAEDYAPFYVDVTTEDPGSAGIIKSNSSDIYYGQRAVISPTRSWYGLNAGGVSYLYAFGGNKDTPSFVFLDTLGYNEKYIAEATSHELGHAFGLSHDGTTLGVEYYTGGNGWAPTMGVSYYQPLTQWSSGEYPNANNKEDDIAIIAAKTAVLADDVGDTPATATVLTAPTLSTVGLIERRADLDVFAVQVGSGQVSISVDSTNVAPNLKIQADLIDAKGAVLIAGVSNGLSSVVQGKVGEGTVYLQVQGVGNGSPLVLGGYSDYDSLGEYRISGSVPSPKSPPKAVATASASTGMEPFTVSFDGSSSVGVDGTLVSWYWDFGDGSTSTQVSPSHTYASYGSYNATLTVKDSNALSASTTLVITVTRKPNVPPVAVAAASAASGTVPFTVSLSSAGSSDSDGKIVSYQWTFGDGTSSTEANPSKTYTAGGDYIVVLTVTDDRGGTASASCEVQVSIAASAFYDLASYSLSQVKVAATSYAQATLVFKDGIGRPLQGVQVRWVWAGVVSGVSTGTTDASGQLILSSPSTKVAGEVSGSLAGCTNPGLYYYNPTLYAEPSTRRLSLTP